LGRKSRRILIWIALLASPAFAGQSLGDEDCNGDPRGLAAGWCMSQELNRKKVEWERRIAPIAVLARSRGKETQKALATLRKKAEAFTGNEASVFAEPNLGGTGYSTVILVGEIKRGEDFVATLERYTRERAPEANPAALKTADDALNATYTEVMAAHKAGDEEVGKGTSGQDVLRQAQRSWIPYRDAWIVFYRLRWKEAAPPKALDREITAALTEQRTKELGRVGAEE
jgi:uncharacterized protein YecT (DUF1311 family)